jgi:hypothetical protein
VPLLELDRDIRTGLREPFIQHSGLARSGFPEHKLDSLVHVAHFFALYYRINVETSVVFNPIGTHSFGDSL